MIELRNWFRQNTDFDSPDTYVFMGRLSKGIEVMQIASLRTESSAQLGALQALIDKTKQAREQIGADMRGREIEESKSNLTARSLFTVQVQEVDRFLRQDFARGFDDKPRSLVVTVETLKSAIRENDSVHYLDALLKSRGFTADELESLRQFARDQERHEHATLIQDS